MLHIINKSPLQTRTLETCLRTLQPGHALLLIEDGVYGATTGSAAEPQVRQACTTSRVYVLQPDLDARGMAGRLMEGITPVDYGGFVDLTVAHSTSHSWL
jgi:tRNA 2-thiouridine synthesizing protein B